MATAIESLEQATGRPLIWATCQYLSYARPPSVLDVRVTIAAAGHQTTQARCVGSVEGTEIFTVNAALGSRALEHAGQWAHRPEVPTPEACGARAMRDEPDQGSVMQHIEMRMANARQWDDFDGTPGDGRSALWARVRASRHGLVHLWAEDGTLLGTASQSTIVRLWKDDAS